MGRLFKVAFWHLPSVPQNAVTWTCDWLNWFSPHHHLHQLHQLPSAMLPRVGVSSSFFLVIFFSGRLPFVLVRLELELLSSSLFLSRYSMKVAFYSAHWHPIWLPRLLSHWSSVWTVPLTLVLRILASAELRLYRTGLPCLIVSRIICSELTQPR